MNIGEMDAVDMIAAREAQSAVAKLDEDAKTRVGNPKPTLEEQLRAAMKVTREHWLLTQAGGNDGRCLRAAVAGVVLHLGMQHPDSKRLATEHRTLAKFGAMLEAAQKGVPVDFERAAKQVEEEDEKFEPIGLLRIWKEK